MSKMPQSRARTLDDIVEERPLQGGLTGIALVALATLGLAVVGAGLVALALLLAG